MKIKEEDKYGFVYIWRDRKHKRYYVGCHWGTEYDGYICSSSWMKQAYQHRPLDFKRRILSRFNDKKILLDEEFKWFKMIKSEELGKRYYNIHNHKFNHWSQYPDKTKSLSEKISASLTGKIQSEETKKKRSKSLMGHKGYWTDKTMSEETKKKMSESYGAEAYQFKPGNEPWNKGKEASEKMKIILRENNKDRVWITNGIDSKTIKTYDSVPEGWYYGRINPSPHLKQYAGVAVKGTIWITNGSECKRVSKDYVIPEGWRRGKTYTERRQSVLNK